MTRASARRPWRLSSLSLLVALSAPSAGRADARDVPAEPHPTLVWIFTQLIPSPEVAVGEGTSRFGLRWQVTPILYSFGVNRRVSPWRALVVEPLVRQSGSIEAFVSPELFTGSLVDTPMLRAGLRSYFPLVAKGEELSFSVGASYTNMNGTSGVGYEVGVYALYGVLGLELTYAPEPSSPVAWITTFRIRYF